MKGKGERVVEIFQRPESEPVVEKVDVEDEPQKLPKKLPTINEFEAFGDKKKAAYLRHYPERYSDVHGARSKNRHRRMTPEAFDKLTRASKIRLVSRHPDASYSV